MNYKEPRVLESRLWGTSAWASLNLKHSWMGNFQSKETCKALGCVDNRICACLEGRMRDRHVPGY